MTAPTTYARRCLHCGSPISDTCVTASIDTEALAMLDAELGRAPEDCLRFFGALWCPSHLYNTVGEMAVDFGLTGNTLRGRFFHAKLPSPTEYLALSRLTRAARLFETYGVTMASVAHALEYSSPQAMGRHVRTRMGLTPWQFAANFTGSQMLTAFRAALVRPYLSTLRGFRPLSATERYRIVTLSPECAA